METTKSSPLVRPVLSEAAERWIDGELDSATYFAEVSRAAALRARAEVDGRLRRDHSGNSPHWGILGEFRSSE
jgi:hypothetical protein